MANPGYVRSTDGASGDDGSTWALANDTIANAITDMVAGDTLYLSHVHAEANNVAGITWTFPGTVASPNRIICANDGAAPPTATATTATMSNVNANSNLVVNGTFLLYGLTMTLGSGANNATITLGNTVAGLQIWEACKFRIAGTAAASRVSIGSSGAAAGTLVRWRNSDARFGNVSQSFQIASPFVWEGGSIESGGSAITTLLAFGATFRNGTVSISGVDLSNLAAACNLVNPATGGSELRALFRNCKLPASWSGSLFTTAPTLAGVRVEMHNCDAGDTNYKLWVEDFAGSIRQETTIVHTGGASDGTTPLSWKMVSSANAEFPVIRLESPEMVKWNAITASRTVTVEIVHDSQGAGSGSALQDDECWLEVMYLGTSGFPLGTWISDARALIGTAADQTTSSETWTTTGLTTPVKQKLAVTFTVAEAGFIHARVVVAKASKTVYVDPLFVVS